MPQRDRQVLASWVEIAGYLGRAVRTVQRYEGKFDFPIHRQVGSARGAVTAYSDEIDEWVSRAKVGNFEAATKIVATISTATLSEASDYHMQAATLHQRAIEQRHDMVLLRTRIQKLFITQREKKKRP